MQTLYSILSVSENADMLEIKAAYKRLAKKYHPDVNPDPAAEALFKDILNAYQILSDPETKKIYDDRLRYQRYEERIRKYRKRAAAKQANYDRQKNVFRPPNPFPEGDEG